MKIKEKSLAGIYGEASREIRTELLAINPMTFDMRRATEIRTKARRLTLALNLAAKKWADRTLIKSYALGARRARAALEILGKKPRRRITSKEKLLRDKALETLVEANISIRKTVDQFLEAALLGAGTARTARVQEFDRDEARRNFAAWGEEAVAAGTSRGALSKKIVDYLRDQIDDEGFIEINGRFYNPRKYAKMVARTEQRKAATEATKDLCRQYENDLVEVSDHGTVCEKCVEIEGNIYSLSGAHPRYPMMPIDFPPHPNCMHSLLPTSEEAIAVR